MPSDEDRSARNARLSPAKQALLARRLQGALARDVEQLTIQSRERQGLSPLSFAQERVWFLHYLEAGSSPYNRPLPLLIQGDLDVRALQQSLHEILRRHEVLRCSYSTHDGRPIQQVQPEAFI